MLPNDLAQPSADRDTSPDEARRRPDPPPPRQPGRGRWIALLLLASLLAGGYYGWRELVPQQAPPAQAAVPAAAPTVTVSQPLVKRITEWDEYTGQFAAAETVEIRARVSGYLQSVHFVDGQMVEAGDLLFVIDPRPFEIALAAAEAELARAKAAVELAEAQLKRAETLRKDDFVSQSAFEERTQESRAARAAVRVAEANVAAARLDLEYTRITAPIRGRVGAATLDPGNLVTGGINGGTTLLTTIVSLDPIHLTFDVSESNLLAYQRAVLDGRLGSLRDGTVPVQARLMDETTWTLQGTIDFVNNQVDRSAGTIRMRAIMPNPRTIIVPGQFGQVRIPGSEPYDAILVPEAALITDQARKIVMTVAEDGTVVPKLVRVGPNRGPELRIIREGLEPTDRIIIDGLLRAQPGAKVTPVEGRIDLPDPEA